MLSSLFRGGAQVEERTLTQNIWGTWAGDPAVSGSPLSTTGAMQLLAVSGCVRYISDSISTLPVDVFTKSPGGVKTEVAAPRWLLQPTVNLGFTAWCSQVLTSLLLHGNAYCMVTRSGTTIVEITPLDPTAVSVTMENGRKVYRIGGREYFGEILHIAGMMLPGAVVGVSPLEYARLSIHLGLEAVHFGSDLFQSSLNMPGVIEMPGKAQGETMIAMANLWRRQRTGKRNRDLPGVLESGATWRQTGVTSEQAQFLETRQWTAAEICGQVFLVDPVEMGIPLAGSSIQYGNMEQRSVATNRRAFMPWYIRIEQALSSLMAMPRYMKFNVDALLRADSVARWTAYEAASRINTAAAGIGMPPVMTTAEMREFEDLDVIDEYPTPPPPPASMQGVLL